MPSPTSPYAADPLAPAAQTARVVSGYRNTVQRSPREPLVVRPTTLSTLTGPVAPERRMSLPGADLAGHGPRRAIGQLMHLRVAVLDEDGSPLPGVVVEIWQANAAGRYAHPNDDDHAPIGPNFLGAARVLTDGRGRIDLRTVKPGAYPVPRSDRWWRPPHIHFSVFGRLWLSRLCTQMFFPAEPLNAQDHILLAVPSADARERLIARAAPLTEGPDNALVFEHTLVVRGRSATPSAP